MAKLTVNLSNFPIESLEPYGILPRHPDDFVVSCHAFKLGMGSEQDVRTTRISPLLTLRFKCRTAYT